jgi:tetratricopeptide (TPR) repeat protein
MAVAPVSTPESELDRFAANARSGRLSSSDISTLEAISVQEPAYTRSRALLLMNSQAKGDDRASGRYLDQLMLVPENQYNPVYLADQARIYVNAGQYEQALKKAELAERYWARLPSELVFSKKAEIYEIQAKAWQGRFYKSPDQLVYLDNAIRAWEKYQQLVAAKGRSDLEARAKTEIAKLQSIQEKSQ